MQQFFGSCCCLVTMLLWLAFFLELARERRRKRKSEMTVPPTPGIDLSALTTSSALSDQAPVIVEIEDCPDEDEEQVEETPLYILPTADDEPIHFLFDCRMRPEGVQPLVEARSPDGIKTVLGEEGWFSQEIRKRPEKIRILGLGQRKPRRFGRRRLLLRS